MRERVLRWLAQADPALREVVLVSLFLLVLFVVGTIGYVFIEGWSVMDGFYMTFITLSTIGFSEVDTLSAFGRLFTIVLALLGIGSVAFIATRTAQLLLANESLRERHMQRSIDRLKDHYIACGYGRIGRRIIDDLKRNDHPFVVIDLDEDKLEEHLQSTDLFVAGNAEDEETLQRAGIERARGLILTLPEDSSNVFVALMARELNPKLFILARSNHHKNHSKLLHAGADKVISPYEIGADRMAQVILRPNVDRFVEEVLGKEGMDLLMEEVTIAEGAPLAGKSLAESNFRQQFDAVVVAVLRHDPDGDEQLQFNPGPSTQLQANDILIVLGNQDMIQRLKREGCSR